MASPAFDHHLGLAERVEDLAVQQFVAQAGVERLHIAVLPGAARRDVGRLGADRRDPTPHRLGHELGAVVRADVSGHAAQDEQVGKHVDHVGRLELAPDPDGQALVGELVDDVQQPELASVMRAVLDEVVAPDVVRPLRPQPDAGPVGQPQPPALWLARRHLQPLPAPDPLHPLVVHQPTRIPQQGGDLAIAVAPILPGQLDDVGGQLLFVVAAPRRLALRRAVLPERPAGAALGDGQHPADMLDAGAPARGA